MTDVPPVTPGGAPKVGIVTAAWNAERFLGATLDSFQAQELTDWVCVVVDDGSTDATAEVVASHAATDPRVRLVRQANAGPAAARNRGLDALADDTPFVVFADADDLLDPHALSTLVAALESDPAAVGAYGLADFIDEEGRTVDEGSFAAIGRVRSGSRGGRRRAWPADAPTTFEAVVSGAQLFPPGRVMLRADVVRAAGGHDINLPRGVEDSEILRRIARFGHLVLVDEVLVRYRKHGSNLSNGAHMPDAYALMMRITHHSPANDAEQRRILRDTWRALQRDGLRYRLRAGLEALTEGRPLEAVDQLSRIPLIAGRWLRGRPRRPPAPWGPPTIERRLVPSTRRRRRAAP